MNQRSSRSSWAGRRGSLFFLSFLGWQGSCDAQTIVQDVQALLAFSTDVDHEDSLLNTWDPDVASPCGAGWNDRTTGWYGVQCNMGDEQSGRVSLLRIEFYELATGQQCDGLSGDVESLVPLTALTYLRVYGCSNVHGNVASLAVLTLLTSLTFQSSDISGSVEPLAALTLATSINVGGTNVGGSIEPLVALAQLRYLLVWDTDVYGDTTHIRANISGLSNWGSRVTDYTKCSSWSGLSYACPEGTEPVSNPNSYAGRSELHCCQSTIGVGRCPVGEYDHDNDPFTACVSCGPGNATNTLLNPGATSCTPCSNGHFDDDMESTTACAVCNAGSFAATAFACERCPAGMADQDSNSATPCDACSAGFFADAGETSCHACTPGTADVDSNASSACEVCQPGFFASVEATSCSLCSAGSIDHDSDPATPCNSSGICPAGSYAPAGSTECMNCTAGYADEDSNPSTPCIECSVGHEQIAPGQTTCIPCAQGTADTDSDATTACEYCGVGAYAPEAGVTCHICSAGQADSDSDPTTACEMCLAGTYSAEAGTECSLCIPGTYDSDSDASTPCFPCAEGTYTAGEISPCVECSAGQADADLDPGTPCTACANGTTSTPDSTNCEPCASGYSDLDSNAATACVPCPRGRYNSLTGRIGGCDACVAGRYAPSLANAAVSDCETCLLGQYAASGASECISCDSGTADEDSNPATPCSTCPNGTYASCGGTECALCEPGRSDSDFDATTPCVECAPGQFWIEDDLQIASCAYCPEGQVDSDINPMTLCAPCPSGQTSPQGSTSCIATGGQCQQLCAVGFEDADCSQNTECTECAAGQYSAGGFFSDETKCKACPAGTYAPQGSNPNECTACSTGKADLDGDASTACDPCSAGTYTASPENRFVSTNATQCLPCYPGSIDNDTDAGTACSPCDAGRANPDSGLIDQNACIRCTPGRWSYETGMAGCPACQEGTYRGRQDLDGCLACDASHGTRCEVGSSYPKAAAGYFAELAVSEGGVNTTSVVACIPFPYACLGTCSREVKAFILSRSSFSLDNEGLSLANCAAGLEGESCTEGYEGPRCSRCVHFSDDFVDGSCDDDADPPIVNGYYRLESRCVPCPCTWIKFYHMVIALFLGAVLFMFGLDMFGSDFAEHASTLAAPILILVSFCQTIATFLDTRIPWPAFLRQMMVIFSGLNFNLELTRPECAGASTQSTVCISFQSPSEAVAVGAGDFGALKKVQVALAMPIFSGAAIAVYALITLYRIQNEVEASKAQRHSARSQLKRKLASVVTTLFTVGAIFFVKSFLRAFDCVSSELDRTRQFMNSAPEIECTSDDHKEIVRLSTIGLASFCGSFVVIWLFLIKAHHSDNPGLGIFAFLADKFEDQYYYWEMVIVVRKVLIMATFLLFDQVVAVLLATFLTIFSLSIHIAARPFEDTGTDWTEMLSLCAQLITLVAGPVFVILSDPESGMSATTASKFHAMLELIGGATLATALGVALIVQVHVWRAVASSGDENEHDDFKIRTEQRRQWQIEQELKRQKTVIAQLMEAHAVLRKEKADIKAMHDHTTVFGDDKGQQSSSSDYHETTNPLQE